MIELLLPCGFDTVEYSWVKATIGIYTLTDYSMTKKCQRTPHQSPPWAPSPIHMFRGDAELDQVQIHDWDKEAEEDEAAAEEEELARVQQEIERLRQEQESVLRRQIAIQCVIAHVRTSTGSERGLQRCNTL
jgi:hypothetical protein